LSLLLALPALTAVVLALAVFAGAARR